MVSLFATNRQGGILLTMVLGMGAVYNMLFASPPWEQPPQGQNNDHAGSMMSSRHAAGVTTMDKRKSSGNNFEQRLQRLELKQGAAAAASTATINVSSSSIIMPHLTAATAAVAGLDEASSTHERQVLQPKGEVLLESVEKTIQEPKEETVMQESRHDEKEALSNGAVKDTLTITADAPVTDDKQSSSSSSVATAAAALEHVLARRQAYADAGDLERWPFRGLGYLYTRKGMVLQATLAGAESGSGSDVSHSSSPRLLQPGRNVVEIHDVNQKLRGDECELLVLWVRVNGPEIFAGSSRAIQGAETDDAPCHWEFPFDLRVSGVYHITVKILLWNPNTSVQSFYGNATTKPDGSRIDNGVMGMQCPYQDGGPESVYNSSLNNETSDNKIDHSEYPFHEGIHGFKLYAPVKSCCEMCSRFQPHCKHWATPPDHFDASFQRNGCELYFQDTTNMIPPSKLLPNRTGITASSSSSIAVLTMAADTSPEKPALLRGRGRNIRHRRRRLADVPHFHGDPHSNPTTYFLGCGWSFVFTLDYPCLSGALDDRVYVVQPNFTFLTTASTTTAPALELNDTPLPLCTLDHEALDSHDGRWVRSAFPNNTVCPNAMTVDDDYRSMFDIVQFDATRPHCWHRDDFHNIGFRCVEMNCALITHESKWRSEVHEEKEFYAVWKPYGCDYVEFTDEQLQTCITNKRIAKIETKGASIAGFLGQYLGVRLKNITMYNNSQSDANDGRSIILSTLSLLHKLEVPDDQIVDTLVKERITTSESQEVYWASGFFLSSERCDHCHISRMNVSNHVAHKTVEGFGYKIINAFDMSAAFTYDTATQFDGMHIIGPVR
jgi:hypothetical protein